MKTLVILAAFTALCSSSFIDNIIPTIPGDNSHYVEGKSRYIWMPDGKGVPRLVDLQQKGDHTSFNDGGESNQYWLYTRYNTEPQIIEYRNVSSLRMTNYNPNLPLIVTVHGWTNNGNSDVNVVLRTAILEAMNVNLIVLDWSEVADGLYASAVAGVANVGEALGNFITWMFNNAGGNWNNVHLVGHSLGAHVVGNTGRATAGRIRRITGLDPAGPLFYLNSDCINSSDAQYVEAIHTDAGLLGILELVGHADFFPNRGETPQPGCLTSSCSHAFSYELFAATVTHDHLVGESCSTLLQATLGLCSGTETLNMGNANFTKTGEGIYYLTTDSEYPY